ncbi:hypothetical protein [Aureivirga sp. CE67]|uniref:hypothetical protein n=1 Tax=Aureivirga sp. CE67 TaxID=1788983 RepID=UPI0018CBCD1A|nr:hypothetical protein [Aureivirga sp. CE67]
MKNIKLFVAMMAISTASFISCSEDDGDDSTPCYECELNGIKNTLCPDADGNIKVLGQTISYEDHKKNIELGGGSCKEK